MTPCLLRAIEDHKYLSSCERGRPVDFLDASRDFRENHEKAWRAEKVLADNALQIAEMRRHLWIESEKAGRDIGRNSAGAEWVARYARVWRGQRESLAANGFLTMDVVLPQAGGLRRQDLPSLLQRVSALSCDVFVGQDRIRQPHFRLDVETGGPGIGFLIFRSERSTELDQLTLEPGACLRIIAFGDDAGQALAAIAEAVGAPVQQASALSAPSTRDS